MQLSSSQGVIKPMPRQIWSYTSRYVVVATVGMNYGIIVNKDQSKTSKLDINMLKADPEGRVSAVTIRNRNDTADSYANISG